MTNNYQKLNEDPNFLKQEHEANIEAQKMVYKLKKLTPYDYFHLKPELYDMRA